MVDFWSPNKFQMFPILRYASYSWSDYLIIEIIMEIMLNIINFVAVTYLVIRMRTTKMMHKNLRVLLVSKYLWIINCRINLQENNLTLILVEMKLMLFNLWTKILIFVRIICSNKDRSLNLKAIYCSLWSRNWNCF